MKLLSSALAAFFFGLTVSSGEDYLPPIAYKGFSLQAGGFVQGLWSNRAIPEDEHGRNLRLSALFAEFELSTPSSAIKLFGELNFCGIGRSETDLLEKAYVEVKATDGAIFRFGRFLSTRGYMTPDPGELETVHYPRVPYEAESTGLQAEIRFPHGWSSVVEVTGQTGDEDLFKRIEGSVRLSKVFSETHLSVGGTVKLAKDFRAYYLDAVWHPVKEFRVKGAFYTAEDFELGRYGGGYLFAGYTLFDRLELHTQIDYRSASMIWTKGVRVWSNDDRMELTVDHESLFPAAGRVSHQVFARFEVRF